MFLPLVGGVMSVVVGRGWSARFGVWSGVGCLSLPVAAHCFSWCASAVKGGLRPSLGRFAFRSPYDSTRAPKGGALPITGKDLITESTLENR